ncbi:MAG: glycosyltransferase [Culicoidibacterales bacterium]
MILVLLGTQDAPFPRIITLLEQALENLDWKHDVLVQAGHTQYESTKTNLQVIPFLTQSEFEMAIENTEVIVCHGGAGTMLTAMQRGKQIIVCARKHAHNEHNNDHQSELVDKLANVGYVQAVQSIDEMQNALERVRKQEFKPRAFDLVNDVVNQVERYIDQITI